MKLSKTKFNLFSSLKTAKLRRKNGLFIVEGEKAAIDSLQWFSPVAIIVTDSFDNTNIPDTVPLYHVSDREMEKLSALSTPSKMIGVYKIPEDEFEDLKVDKGLYIVLDGIQDPGNLGTIIRTCHWFGIFQIFASYNTVDVFNAKAIQSAMGSFGRVKVTYCDIRKLIQSNPDLPVYGTLLNGENIFKKSLASNGFVIMGNEGNGISSDIRSLVTDPLLIPPKFKNDHSESLNVAIATAIVISQFVR